MRYIVLGVASDAEAQRLIDDMTENPGQPLRSPRWSNAVHAELATMPAPRAVEHDCTLATT
jgi:hypothetical protein